MKVKKNWQPQKMTNLKIVMKTLQGGGQTKANKRWGGMVERAELKLDEKPPINSRGLHIDTPFIEKHFNKKSKLQTIKNLMHKRTAENGYLYVLFSQNNFLKSKFYSLNTAWTENLSRL